MFLLNDSSEHIVIGVSNADENASVLQDFLGIVIRFEIIRFALNDIIMIMQSDAVQLQFVGLLNGHIGEGQHDFLEANGPNADVVGVEFEVAEGRFIGAECIGRELFSKRYTDRIGAVMRLRNQSYRFEFGRALYDQLDGVRE